MSVRTYAMITYKPVDLHPRKFVFYPNLKHDQELIDALPERGLPPVLAHRHTELLTSTKEKPIGNLRYAYAPEIGEIIFNSKVLHKKTLELLVEAYQVMLCLSSLGHDAIYFITWQTGTDEPNK